MGFTVILRGFKVPITLLDRFLKADGHGHFAESDTETMFMLSKLTGPGCDGTSARLFIPQKERHTRADHAYLAYACVMVHAQRKLDLAKQLPDTAPPGFAERRREILGFAKPGEEALLRVEGVQDVEGEDLAAALYVVVVDNAVFWWSSPWVREVSFPNLFGRQVSGLSDL